MACGSIALFRVQHSAYKKPSSSCSASAFAVEVTADVRSDTLFAPFHWGGKSAANVLTNAALDPLSRMPEFKVCAVRASAVSAPADQGGA